MMHPLSAMGIVLAILGGMLGSLTLFRRLVSPHPELLRKMLHIGMGLVTLSFPWLFDRVWPVVVLGVLSIALLTSLRLLSPLRKSVGQVVSGVSRFSLGEMYFPLAVAILWVLYLEAPASDPPERRLLGYLVPLLLLTLADALAALVGVSYGRLRYETPDGMKSLEGSLAFFLCSFVCIHVPILLMTDRGRAETLLIAVLLAWLSTMFEAIAWSGLDNLILPLVAHLLLLTYWDKSATGLLERLVAMAALTVFALAFYRWTPLRGSAVLGTSLIGYVCWAIGGWPWLLPPLLLFTLSAVLSFRYPAAKDKTLNVHAVESVTSAGLAWLFLSRILDRPEWLYPFTISFAAHLGMVALSRLRLANPTTPMPVLIALASGLGWLVMLIPYVLMHPDSPHVMQEALFALLPTGLAVVGFYLVQPGLDDCPFDVARWVRQALVALVTSMLGLVPPLLGK